MRESEKGKECRKERVRKGNVRQEKGRKEKRGEKRRKEKRGEMKKEEKERKMWKGKSQRVKREKVKE
jgi:hypothetical protein